MNNVIKFKPKQRLVIHDGKVRAKPSAELDLEFGDRIQRIRTSLEKINKLMAELKGKKAYD